jgi:predicted TIM-barrel fold metal-dependent hydrolase
MNIREEDLVHLAGAEEASFPSPVPTQIVSSEEYFPPPQNQQQKQVEARLVEFADKVAKRNGLSRRRFFQTAAGMAASFLVMNQVYGEVFEIAENEADILEVAEQHARQRSKQFVLDCHSHFLRDDTRLMQFVAMREAAGKAGWNSDLSKKPQTIADLKFNNYFKEIYLDSDTQVVLLSNAPSDDPQDWFLSNDTVFKTRDRVNQQAGNRRMLAHYTIVPGQKGWLEGIDQAISEWKPDSWKGYTIGDNTHKATSAYPWLMDDEKLMYPAYERFLKAGIKNVCVHKGLFPPADETKYPNLTRYAKVDDVGKAAKDWPQLNFIIYHSGYRHVGGDPAVAMAEFDQTGRISWVSDLVEIPQKYGVKNVYGDLGQLFAWSTVAQPRLAAAMMASLVQGLGADHVVWGTDAVWTGSPQWQIEGLRRLEVPEDMQKKYGYKPLGPADGPIKNAIFADNSVRLYNFEQEKRRILSSPDKLAEIKADYLLNGPGRSNLRYGYVPKPA